MRGRVGRFSDEQIRDIRRRLKPRRDTYRSVAAEYGVCLATIQQIINGKLYNHVPDEGGKAAS